MTDGRHGGGMERIFPSTLRSRIVLVSTCVSAAVLVFVLVVLYLVLATELRAAVNDTIGARLDDLASAVDAGDTSVIAADPYAQLIGRDGRVLARSAAAPDTPVVPVDRARTAAVRARALDRLDAPGLPGRSLFRARVVGSSGETLLAGGSLEAAEAARERTLVLLLLSLPVLALALLIGIRRVVAAAMRPVRELTREAEEISVTGLDHRLPLVPGDDELADLSRTLNGMLDRLARSVQREREFLDDASHELRTPLAVLMGELELALTVDDEAEVRHGLRVAHEEARRLASLAQDLLVLGRQRAAGDVPAAPTIDLNEVVASTVTRTRGALACRVEVCGGPTSVRADASRVERVVANLLQNAAAAGAGRVVCRTGTEGPDALLEVFDDGPGFPPGLLPHAFERFRRGDPARTRRGDADTGTGLGLAIVTAVAESLGGRATASNDSPLGGARVVVRLPRADPGADPAPRVR